ncbi:MAG: glycosyltransferase, partial [Clostridia bacterium]|nr:glycosyltransferase [Clostridia bacterium]
GSTDQTGAIADSYADDPRVMVIHQENRGFSGARNRGLSQIFAKYIAFVDSDDMMTPDSIEALISTAEKEDADIVQGGYFCLGSDGSQIVGQKYDYKVGDSSNNNITGFPWMKIWKSYIFEKIKLPEGFWFEDAFISFLILPQKYRSVTIPNMVYTYRTNYQGISRSAHKYPKCVDSYWVTECMISEAQRLKLPMDERYHRKLLGQILLTYKRTFNVPEDIKKAIFVLSSELLKNHFPSPIKSKQYKNLDVALRKKDWGFYKTYCKNKLRK